MELSSTPSTPPWRVHVYSTAVHRFNQQLRTISQVSWDVTPCRSVGVPQREGLIQQQHHIPGHLHPLHISYGNLKSNRTNEKYGIKRKISLGLIEMVQFICCRNWGRGSNSSSSSRTTANQTKYQRHYFIPSHLRLCPTSYFFLFCFVPFFSNFPLCQTTDTQVCTEILNCDFAQEMTLLVMLT